MKEHFQAAGDAMMKGFARFSTFKIVVALKDAFILTLPVTLLGSIFLLVANIPINGYSDFMSKYLTENWAIGLNQAYSATFNVLAIVVAVGVGYSYVHNEKLDGISGAILAMVSFFCVSPSSFGIDHSTVDALPKGSSAEVANVIPLTWVGGNGIISAVICGLFSAWVFTKCIKKNVRIKMPDSVPEGVSNAFSALIPGFIVLCASALAYQLCEIFGGVSLTEMIFKVIQSPLQGLTDNLAGAIIFAILPPLMFWCGIHGPNVMQGILLPLATANSLANQQLIDSGVALTRDNGAHIITPQLYDLFNKFGGCGLTLGLLIAVFIVGRSQQLREVSKMSFVPGLFNINEPVIFGLPICFNPYFLAPFILAPLAAIVVMYFVQITGFIAPFGAVQVPWTTPPIISGFIVAGWKGSLLQILITAMSTLIYLPFVKMQDRIYVKEEAEMAAAEAEA
ncbi:PTS sugar transporter subunit IIC [Bifidobacterium sp. MA2]|uniref:Permease IIC component n=1 Tax=Bifidobacterium santillanense TaxID=2809028 RepID=A0ABS5URE1_9BIFI|nr:PTS transporter subunit EIIC [Bifidobacterium santillanense]MBT1173378.1 PTS sugar transporter subunit IIC [Bifidobacterium santillanense]